VLNLFTVALFAVSFGLRLSNPLGSFPVLISFAGLVSLAIAGWLGGELVYVHQMGVGKPRR